jgi:hypothetical protein
MVTASIMNNGDLLFMVLVGLELINPPEDAANLSVETIQGWLWFTRIVTVWSSYNEI